MPIPISLPGADLQALKAGIHQLLNPTRWSGWVWSAEFSLRRWLTPATNAREFVALIGMLTRWGEAVMIRSKLEKNRGISGAILGDSQIHGFPCHGPIHASLNTLMDTGHSPLGFPHTEASRIRVGDGLVIWDISDRVTTNENSSDVFVKKPAISSFFA